MKQVYTPVNFNIHCCVMLTMLNSYNMSAYCMSSDGIVVNKISKGNATEFNTEMKGSDQVGGESV